MLSLMHNGQPSETLPTIDRREDTARAREARDIAGRIRRIGRRPSHLCGHGGARREEHHHTQPDQIRTSAQAASQRSHRFLARVLVQRFCYDQ